MHFEIKKGNRHTPFYATIALQDYTMENVNTEIESSQELIIDVEPDQELLEWTHKRIIIPINTYEKFMALGKDDKIWTDAYMIYNHLYYTARLQKTNKVWANRRYIINALHWGKSRVSDALKWLLKYGFIEKSYQDKNADGSFGKVYTTIKYLSISPHRGLDTDNGDEATKPSRFKNKEKPEIVPDAPLKERTDNEKNIKPAVMKLGDVKPLVDAVLEICGVTRKDMERRERVKETLERNKRILTNEGAING